MRILRPTTSISGTNLLYELVWHMLAWPWLKRSQRRWKRVQNYQLQCKLAPTHFLFTHADDSRESIAFITSVRVSARQNRNGWNYSHKTYHRDSPSRVLATHSISGQRSRSQGHKVQKHISSVSDRVVGVSLHSIEWPASSFPVLCQIWRNHHTQQHKLVLQKAGNYVHLKTMIDFNHVFVALPVVFLILRVNHIKDNVSPLISVFHLFHCFIQCQPDQSVIIIVPWHLNTCICCPTKFCTTFMPTSICHQYSDTVNWDMKKDNWSYRKNIPDPGSSNPWRFPRRFLADIMSWS